MNLESPFFSGIIHAEVTKGNIADSQVKAIVGIGGFLKPSNRNFCFRVSELCHTPSQGVELHAEEIAVLLHILRHILEESA